MKMTKTLLNILRNSKYILIFFEEIQLQKMQMAQVKNPQHMSKKVRSFKTPVDIV